MSSTETTAPMRISKTRELTMPLALLVSLLVAGAVAYARWSTTEEKLDRHTAQISGLEAEAKTTREILIRIDENVKDLRRDARRNNP